MTTHTAVSADREIALELIDLPANVRQLDVTHVEDLAGSIALRGLIVPLAVRPVEARFELVAGFHRHAAATRLGLTSVPVIVRDVEGESADRAAENVLRKQLTPLEEARAVQAMLEQGYTLDGAATALGWAKQRVTARAKILELPASAQDLIGSGELPVSGVDALLAIAAVSAPLCELVADAIAEIAQRGSDVSASFVRDPAWIVGRALERAQGAVWAAYLTTTQGDELVGLKLGKKTEALLDEADRLHRGLDRYAYGPPRIAFTEADADQARAAGVLLELGRAPLVLDRGVYRELAKTAVARTVENLRARAADRAEEKAEARRQTAGHRERTPLEELEADHRTQLREFATRTHGVNLDLGAALLDGLAAVDPADITVARFFAYGLLGPDSASYLGASDHAARTIAANGLRLILEEHRTTETPGRKDGSPGKTKVTYCELEQATAWLWKFIDGAKTAGELYGRVLVVFAAQHYALQTALPTAQRRGSVLPASRKDHARRAFEKLTKTHLPATYYQLTRAIDRAAREHHQRVNELRDRSSAAASGVARNGKDSAPSGAEDLELSTDDEPVVTVGEDVEPTTGEHLEPATDAARVVGAVGEVAGEDLGEPVQA